MPTKKQLKETKRVSIIEGSFYWIMAGFGTLFITPFALRFGATTADVGFLQTFPYLIGSVLQVFYQKLASLFSNRRRLIQSLVSIQALSWLALIILPLLWRNEAVALIIFIYSIGIIAETFANPAWTSWMADVVREKERNAYFGKRNEITCFVAFIATLTAGFALNFFQGAYGWVIAFAVVFTIAFAGRMACFFLFNRMTEPAEKRFKAEGGFRDFLKTMRSTAFGRLTLYMTFLSFAVYVSSPYFAVYMLRDLRFDYLTFGVIAAAMQITLFLTPTYWGWLGKKFGDKTTLYASGLLVVLVPLGWVLCTNPALIFVIEMASGMGWAGQRLASFNLILKTAPEKSRARFVAYYNLFVGIALFAGAMAGALLASYFENAFLLFATGLPAVFLVSFFLRLAAVALCVPKIQVESKPVESKAELLKLVTVYPLRSAMHEIHSGMLVGLKGARLVKTKILKRVKK